MSEFKGPKINWLAAAGSALGAVTSAVLLSTLGAAGTLIGAALGSLIITVGGSVYSYSLQRAKTGLEKTAEKVKTAGGKAGARKNIGPITATSDRDNAEHTSRLESVAASGEGNAPAEKVSWKQSLRALPWKRIAGLAAGLFAVTVVIILAFELSTGRPVSSYTGGTSSDSTGTTFSGLTNRGGDDSPGTENPGDDNPERAPEQLDEQDVEQGPQEFESPELQEDPAPEEAPAIPEPQPEEPEPQQEQEVVPEAPAQ